MTVTVGHDSQKTRKTLVVGGKSYAYYSIPAAEAAGLGEAQMDQAEKFTRAIMGPVAQAVMTPIFVVLFGLLCALIIAAIVKRPAAEAPKAA